LDDVWEPVPASPVRRIAAWLLDYVLIAAYLILLTAATIGLEASPRRGIVTSAMRQPGSAELLGFVSLTLPVVLYFALFEASSMRATVGKRALGIAVVDVRGRRLATPRALLREAVRFTPWELSHALIWRVAISPAPGSTPLWLITGFGVVYALVLLYLVSLFIGPRHRTVYDLLAGSLVIRR
jgi:uncharacterized RDD family membrane protein YckC